MMDTEKFASSPAFFEAKYRNEADPWGFASDSYELSRYASLLAALGKRRYQKAYEPGCSIGVFTEYLAGICDNVDAIDFSPTASAQALARCALLSNVKVRCAAIPEKVPPLGYDLLVLSEIGYYFAPEVWADIIAGLVRPMASGTTVLAAHWLGTSGDHLTTGDQVHNVLLASSLLRVEHSERRALLRLDRLVRL